MGTELQVKEFVDELRREGVAIWLDGAALRLRAPRSKLDPEKRQKIHSLSRELAAYLKNGSDTDGAAHDILPLKSALKFAPASFGQERFWLLDQLGVGDTAYNELSMMRLEGAIDHGGLERCFAQLIERHESLRTHFAMRDDHLVQVIEPTIDFAVVHIDLRSSSRSIQDRALKRIEREIVREKFDLTRGPLLRCRVARLSEDEHVLLVCMHHIVSDAWSAAVLMRELATLYAAFRDGRNAPLAELPIQYADYARWQRDWLQGETLARQVEYWKDRLSGAPAALDLPTDRPRPAVASHEGGTVQFALPAGLSSQLTELSRHKGVTLYMMLVAAFQVLLARYSDQDDIVVGSPIAGRRRRELEGLIGFFVNTLVIRSDLSGDPRFAELLARVKEACLGAYAHQDLPFEKLVEELRPVRDLSRQPIFQVMFVLQNIPREELSVAGLRVIPIDAEQMTSRFDLTVLVHETPAGLRGHIEYASDLFQRATVERLAGHYRALLEGVVADPELRLSQLPLLTDGERRQLLEEWNDTAAHYPHDRCLHELFAAQASRAPDAVALVFEDERLSYRELDARSNQLAHYLRSLGVGPEIVVGLCVERSPDMVIGLLATLKAGGAYLPLDPAYPRDRLAYMLSDARASVLLTQGPLVDRLPPHDARTVLLDTDWDAIERESVTLPPNTARPGNLAYVIYTSGSTGKPKGVMITHACVARLLNATQAWFGFGPADVWTLFHSYAFDFSVWELWGALACGGRLVVVPFAVSRTPDAFHALVCREEVTILNQTPSAFDVLSQVAVASERETKLRLVIFGGEALSLPRLKSWFDRYGDEQPRLVNMYGITETTVHVTYRPLRASDLASSLGSVIGGPIPDLQAYVLDQQQTLVPVGVGGELCIGGAGLARGYLRRPDLTAERFVPSPFGDGERLYRTGDLARWRADGELEYLGRIDHQVKLRGYRIELGEIETALAAHADIEQAVVVAREDAPGEQRLVAYVVGVDGAALDTSALRAHLRQSLPDYMVPSVFVVLGQLPLTPNGKADRRALPAPEGRPDVGTYVAPRSETEKIIADIWSDLLKVEKVGIYDNFFELGGHSLLAIRLIAQLRQRGLTLDIRTVFAMPTLAELAAVARGNDGVEIPPNLIAPGSLTITPDMLPLVALEQAEIDRGVATVPGGAANVQDIYPLTPLQEGILFHHLMASEGDVYLLRSLLTFDDRARLDGFVTAMQAVIDRHDILRTGVVWEGLSQPVQVVWRQATLALEEVELAAGGDAAEQLLARFDPLRYRLDVRRAPLLRAFVTHDALRDRWLLLVLNHHLIEDNTTLRIMIKEIQAHVLGQADRLAAAVPFRNFVAQARLGASAEEHEAFFRDLLGDVDEPTVPFGLADVRGEGTNLEAAHVTLDEELARRLRGRARALGVSPASLFHVAWAQVLARTSGRRDVVFGTVLFGRVQGSEDLDRALGLFINTLPVRIRVDEEGVEDCVRHTHKLLTGLLQHMHASLALAQRCSAVATSVPLFSALLNYRHSPEGHEAPAAWKETQLLGSEERTSYPLTLTVDDLGDGFVLTAQVQKTVGAERVCGFVRTALGGLADALESTSTTPVRNLEVLPAFERRQLFEEWNATGAAYPQEKCLHELFDAQAARTPQAVAVMYEDRRLTYGELEARANQLAHHLRVLGVGPETVVGLCVERSPEMVIALLAILKAGGAYLPLDPSYPAERLGYMLTDARAPVLVTQEALLARLPSHTAHVVRLDADADAIARQSATAPRNTVRPANLSYVIYTSGSTGKPKGVMGPHRIVVNRIAAQEAIDPFTDTDVGIQKTSLSFVDSVFEILGPLVNGQPLLIVSRDTAADVVALADALNEHRVTRLIVVPSLLRELLSLPDVERFLRSLRSVTVSGEAVDGDLCRRFFDVLPQGNLINLYGSSEVAGDATGSRLPRETLSVPIGRPIANTQVYVLDADFGILPVGVGGELYIGGAGLARGYLGRSDLTAERFVPNPFGDGERLYRTGDLARWRADGELEYLGRIDHQVKLRGYRIELGEIEAALLRHGAVEQAVVVAREDAPGEKRLVAYVVPSEKTPAQDDATMHFGLFYFAESSEQDENKYRLYLEGARLADQLGLGAVWTPERHFTEIAAAFPNPSVLSAALAMVTKRIQLRAGSVVMPLHDPVRVAEEWAVVDNLSGGRVGISFASGWVPKDFVFAPEAYADRHRVMLDGMEQVRRLWRGETVMLRNGVGQEIPVTTLPRPVQAELPVWLTATQSPATFEAAGAVGANILTALMIQTISDLAEKIAIYRAARKAHGHDPAAGIVSVMLHTFVAETDDAALQAAREPMIAYLRSHAYLTEFVLKDRKIIAPIAHDDIERLIPLSLERYLSTSSLIGSEATCLRMVERLQKIGVGEIACLVDFGVDTDTVLASLPRLNALATRNRRSLAIGKLRGELARELPDYMLPSHFVALDSLPLTPNGKVDRLALPVPEGSLESREYIAPRTPIEETLRAIWSEVLNLDRVGVTDSFFELGGHSLLAMRMIARLREAFAIELPLRVLFEAPTIEELAVRITNSASDQPNGYTQTAAQFPIITPDVETRHEPFPLNDIQEAYWIGRREEFALGNVAAYNYFELDTDGLDVERLNVAWQKLIERHDMLRAVVLPDGSQQILAQAPVYRFPIHDLRETPQNAVERMLLSTRNRLSHQVLPTERWPLFTIEASLLPQGRARIHFGIDLIICDALSQAILQRELAMLYRDPDIQLPSLTVSYRDYVKAGQALKSTEFYQAAWTYWSSRFGEMPPAPALPLATKPGSVTRPRFVQLRGQLVRKDWRRIKLQAEKAGVTPTAVLLSIYADVLALFTGETRFTLNLTVFNRFPLHEQVNDIVGDFTSLLPLVVDNDEPAPFTVRTQRIQRQLWSDLDHRLMSGVRIARERARASGAQRGAMLPVVFTSMLGMQRLDDGEQLSSFGEFVATSSQTPQVWLDLQIGELAGELVHSWAYVDGLFPPGLIDALFETFCNELSALAEVDSNWSLAYLDVLPQTQLKERQSANATDRPIPDLRLEDLFLAQVQLRPDATAVIATDKALSYRELERYSLAIAMQVIDVGVSSRGMVGVVMEKGWEQIVAVLGVLRAGAAYVPLDPVLPIERLHHLLADCGIRTVLTQAKYKNRLIWPADTTLIAVDHKRPAARNRKLKAPPRSPEDLAYVIHTSGSTGMPKGVMISHRGAVNTILDINEKCLISEHDRLLSVSSLSFDLSVYDIFGTLAAGAAVVLPEPSSHPEPSRWVDLIVKNQVTLWNSVPALLELMLEQAETGGAQLKLRLAMLSGDWIPLTLPDRLRRTARNARLLAMGGATEASIWSNYKWVDRLDGRWVSIPYGRPLANQLFHVLSRLMQPCPVWVPGELYIGGAGLALGYWHDDERTKERFVIHPQTGERLYRTGDLGRYLPDGEIEFLGRQDTQVKVSGHRIELGEIEHALHQHPELSGCAVAAIGETRGQKKLVAYVVPKPEHVVTTENIRQFLRQKLPNHMVPNQVVSLERLPLTPSGKVDRRALPVPKKTNLGSPDEGAITQIQQSLLKIWAEVINLEQIGIHDDFFQNGGDSLLAMRVAARIREKLKFSITAAAMFEYPTVAELARFLEIGANRAGVAQGAFGPLSTAIPAIDIITEPRERERFKTQELGLRHFLESDYFLNLAAGPLNGEKIDIDSFRRNSRHFAKDRVSFEGFSSVLSVLRRRMINGTRKYRYPSAGGLYPVQAYVHVRETGDGVGVEGVPEGAYYYSPARGGLHPITPGAKLERKIHRLLNRPVFDQASFTLFLIADLQAIVPIYGMEGLRMACLEAGMMSQSLDEAAHANGIGICHVETMEFDVCMSIFDLSESHLLLHAMMGGRLAPYIGADGWSFVDESTRSPTISSEWEEWVI